MEDDLSLEGGSMEDDRRRKRKRIEKPLYEFSDVVETREEMVIEGEAKSTDSLIEKLGLSTEEIEMIRTVVLERAREAWPELKLSYDPDEKFWQFTDIYDKNFRSMHDLTAADADGWYDDLHAYNVLEDIPMYFKDIEHGELEEIDPMEFGEISKFLSEFDTHFKRYFTDAPQSEAGKIQVLVNAWVEDQNDLVQRAKDRMDVPDLLILIQYDPENVLKIPERFIGDPTPIRRLTQNFANELFSTRENYISSKSEKFMQQFEIMEFIHKHLNVFKRIKLDGDIVMYFDYVRMFMKTRRKIMDPEFRDGLFYAREESYALYSAFERGLEEAEEAKKFAKDSGIPFDPVLLDLTPLFETPSEIIKLMMKWRIRRSEDDPFPVTTIEESKMIKSLLLFKDLAKQHSGFSPIPTQLRVARRDRESYRYASKSRWNGYESPLRTTTVLMYFFDDTLGYEFFRKDRSGTKLQDLGWPDMFFGNRLGKIIGQAVNDAKTMQKIMSGPDVKKMPRETFENTFKVLQSLASVSKADLLNQLEVSRSFFIPGMEYYGRDIPDIKEIYGNSKDEILSKLDDLLDLIIEKAISIDRTLDPLTLADVHKKNVLDGYGYRLDRIINALTEINDIESKIEESIPTISRSEPSIRKRALYKSISMRANPLSSKTMYSPKMKSLDWDFFF